LVSGTLHRGLILFLMVFVCAISAPWRAHVTVKRTADTLSIITALDDPNQSLGARARIADNRMVVTFNHPVAMDVSDVTRQAPDLIALASLGRDGQSLTLALKKPLIVSTEARTGAVRFALTAPAGAEPIGLGPVIAPRETAAGARSSVNAVPPGGVVMGEVEAADKSQTTVAFRWAGPVGAAVFRRGDALWVIFDADAKLNLEEVASSTRFLRGITLIRGQGFTGFRAKAEPTMLVSASVEGNTWRVTFGDRKSSDPTTALTALRQTKEGIGSRLVVKLPGSTNVFWMDDPDAEDRIAVVTALPPSRGMISERQMVDATLVETAQGVVVAPRRDDVVVSLEGDDVVLERPMGLALSGGLIRQAQAAPTEYFKDISGGNFLKEYDTLLQNAAIEAATPRGPANGRIGLAKFLVEHEMATEAIGLLSLMMQSDPTLGTEPEVRLLRGAALAMMGRNDDARLDLQLVTADPVAALWRGYVESEDMAWLEARREFEAGSEGLSTLPREWRVRMLIRLARAHYELNDLGAARLTILKALAEAPPPALQLQARLVEALIYAAQGNTRVGRLLAVLATCPDPEVAARAILEQTVFLLKTGDMKVEQGVEILQGLRYRWRGDDYELEVARALGKLYMQMGDNRHGIEVMRSAWLRQPANPVGRKLADELMGAFTAMFLDGGADELDPIQAVGMFYDFKELTPVGADGDRMIRKLAQRLVAFDLLDQAAELLQYQIDERLDMGVVKARVATDLAGIYLMARKPERAYQAISSSRYTLLPPDLNRDRRIIEARALADLGRPDHALDVISNDQTADAKSLRADIAWRMRDWPVAAARLEAVLGARWKTAARLSPEEQGLVLRLAIAYSLAGNQAGVDGLSARYGTMMSTTEQAIAFQTVTSKADVKGAELREAAKRIADIDTFSGFSKRLKDKFASDPAPIGDAKSAVTTAADASATPAPAPAG
jgi:hypothetical protein